MEDLLDDNTSEDQRTIQSGNENETAQAHYGGVNDSYNNEREIYTIDNRYQPYDRENRERPRPKSESQREGQLINKKTVSIQPKEFEETYPLIDDDDLMQDDLLAPTRAPRRKRGPSIVDSIVAYNVADDILC
ncbi:4482_t:CDS:2 [Dentiscutata heterogama]|uniref:4482_t:CDS:1 n=1 Tax=Dentiscutata heterogama TaxID=1316150 RepID=A0ACA9P771_9GLOM|nr:4482_t:CDS:2 [Dentiscutata heterogama]